MTVFINLMDVIGLGVFALVFLFVFVPMLVSSALVERRRRKSR